MADLPDDLAAWVEEVAGGALVGSARLSGGNRHATWALSVRRAGGGAAELVLRVGAPHEGDGPSPLEREAAAYRALAGTGVPVPALLAAHPERDALLVTRMPGHPDLAAVAGGEREEVAADLVRSLAALHALDPASLDLGVLAAAGGTLARLAAGLAQLQARYRGTGRADPLIEAGLTWCAANLPGHDGPPSLLHGDAGPGNLLFEGGRVTALVDWELARLGDPLEDLAALALRMVHGGLDGFAGLVAVYAEAAGAPVDGQRLAWHQVLAASRIVVLRHVQDAVEADALVANRLISRTLHRRLLVEGLAAATGLPLPRPPAPPAATTAGTPLYRAAAALLRTAVLPAVDGEAAAATKAVARLVKHLDEVDRLGPAAEAATREALLAVLPGARGATADLRVALAERLRSGSIPVTTALTPLATITAWETELLRPAMGALADRPLPRLEAWGAR